MRVELFSQRMNKFICTVKTLIIKSSYEETKGSCNAFRKLYQKSEFNNSKKVKQLKQQKFKHTSLIKRATTSVKCIHISNIHTGDVCPLY